MYKRVLDKNEDFFDNIDCEIKAYLLGFFAADGCVSETNRLGINISEKDLYIIELFQKYISPNSVITRKHSNKSVVNRQPQVLIRITSSKLTESLAKYKIVANKTNNPFSMNLIPEELKEHYIRGYFDGDGSIYYGRSQNRNKVCVNFTNSTREIFDEFIDYFNKKNLKFKFEIKKSVKLKEYYVMAIYNKKDIKLFFDIIYRDCNFYLKRKFDKFVYVNTVLTKENNKSLVV